MKAEWRIKKKKEKCHEYKKRKNIRMNKGEKEWKIKEVKKKKKK